MNLRGNTHLIPVSTYTHIHMLKVICPNSSKSLLKYQVRTYQKVTFILIFSIEPDYSPDSSIHTHLLAQTCDKTRLWLEFRHH